MLDTHCHALAAGHSHAIAVACFYCFAERLSLSISDSAGLSNEVVFAYSLCVAHRVAVHVLQAVAVAHSVDYADAVTFIDAKHVPFPVRYGLGFCECGTVGVGISLRNS